MAVIARDEVTIAVAVDVEGVTDWYLLQASSATPPAKPTVVDPSALGWSLTEPGYDGTSTVTLYKCQRTMLTDGTFAWGAVSVSSAYEAAKQAANAVKTVAQILVGPEGDGGILAEVTQARAGHDDLATAIDAATGLSYDCACVEDDGGGYTLTARLMRGGEDVTDEYDPDRLVWILRDEDGDRLYARGRQCTVPASVAGYRTSVVGGLDDAGQMVEHLIIDSSGAMLATSAGEALLSKTIWEDQ